MSGRPEDPPPEQPAEDWIEQHTDVEPSVVDSESDSVLDETDTIEADDGDVLEQSMVLDEDEPYPHD
jgi:hypothetical protein